MLTTESQQVRDLPQFEAEVLNFQYHEEVKSDKSSLQSTKKRKREEMEAEHKLEEDKEEEQKESVQS